MEWWKQRYMIARVLVKYYYLAFLQKIYRTVIHLQKNNYEIQYALHDRIYKIRTRSRRTPTQIMDVQDHEGNDITEEVRSYLGPNEDFHGQRLRPFDIGYERLCVRLRNGREKIFKTDEYIQFDD